MNLPNKLTVFRMILVPIFIIIGYVGIPGELLGISSTFWVMNLIFIIASITDKLDGTIARKNNLVTNFGKFLDPIADKILVISALVMLVEFGKIPAWIPIIVIAREFLVSGYRLIAVQASGNVIAANIWGKLKTVTQMVAIILVFADKYNFFDFVKNAGNMGTGYLVVNILSSVILAFSVVATIFSGWSYLKGGKDLLKDA
ncbi:MAG: CDP-diacylglycerol--glycerol-3-phosphate 3-phosphatidyltransferase [Clostridia bacterium]|nr:CDP-diacylglycerol--glycerol-3-phosphate 3-phosphatidyltransferase [Clostridia bacterium]